MVNAPVGMVVRFWEARVADERLDDAVAWARSVLEPAALAAGAQSVEVLSSPADQATANPPRVVVLMRFAAVPDFAEPPVDNAVIERAHAWNFFTA